MRPVNEIVIHTFATRKDWFGGKPFVDKVAEVKRWHVQDNGWSDLGYHYLIGKEGEVATGRPIERVGAHVQGHNTNTIGISLEGGFGGVADGEFHDNYTDAQEESLVDLIKGLRAEYGPLKLSGHNQYANKACPCFSVPQWAKYAFPAPAQHPLAALITALTKLFGAKK